MVPEVERELIRKCRAGDSRFYEPLVRAYEQPGLPLVVLHHSDGSEAGRITGLVESDDFLEMMGAVR